MTSLTIGNERPARMPIFEVRLAKTVNERVAAQALRYQVFIAEMGATLSGQNDASGLERDRFDRYAHHLLLYDRSRPDNDQVVGAYRLLDEQGARAAGGFYSETEYDLSLLRGSGRRLIELGRSCLHKEYRGGAGLWHLWQGLAAFVQERRAEVLFGVASFPGTDPAAIAQPLSVLAKDHAAPPSLTARSRVHQNMSLTAEINRVAAMKQMPALIKAYLRLGGKVGDGAFIDQDFNTIDVCLILDLANMNPRQRALYAGPSV